jgi:folylpolyglutamate synthase/dihydropteroate synthase
MPVCAYHLGQLAEGGLTRRAGQSRPVGHGTSYCSLLHATASVIPWARKIVLDGAHNPQKLASLVEALRLSGISEATVIASFIRSPQAKMPANLLAIRDLATELTLAEFGTIQGLAKQSPPASELAAEARHLGYGSVTAARSLAEALDRALASRFPVIVITGPLYLIAQIRPLIVQVTTYQASGQ